MPSPPSSCPDVDTNKKLEPDVRRLAHLASPKNSAMPGPLSAPQRNHPLCGVDTTIRSLPRSNLAITFFAVASRSSTPSTSSDAFAPDLAADISAGSSCGETSATGIGHGPAPAGTFSAMISLVEPSVIAITADAPAFEAARTISACPDPLTTAERLSNGNFTRAILPPSERGTGLFSKRGREPLTGDEPVPRGNHNGNALMFLSPLL